jgi:hypothetical protein
VPLPVAGTAEAFFRPLPSPCPGEASPGGRLGRAVQWLVLELGPRPGLDLAGAELGAAIDLGAIEGSNPHPLRPEIPAPWLAFGPSNPHPPGVISPEAFEGQAAAWPGCEGVISSAGPGATAAIITAVAAPPWRA